MTSVPPFARPQLATKRQQEQERPGHSFPQKRLQLGEEPTKSRGSEPFGEKDLERRDLLNLSTYEYGNSKESHSDALDRLAPDASQTDSIVCYGRLPGIGVQLKWLPESHQPCHQASIDGDSHMLMRPELTADHGILFTLAGDAVAVLNKKSFQALQACVAGDEHDRNRNHVEAWVLESEWTAKVSDLQNKSANSRKVVRMEVDLLLYGPANGKSQNHIASSLGSYQTYLQDPLPGLFRPPYVNPQSLVLPHLEIDSRQLGHILPGVVLADEGSGTDDEADEVGETNSEQMIDLIADIDSFLEELPRQQMSNLVFRDARIISPLLSHQQDAVNFMLSRETGCLPQSESLWQIKSLENGQPCYQHTITGVKSKSPEDFFGGILADDMGLGKTLATLTSVLMSVNSALEFANRKTYKKSGRERISTTTVSKATVVVVPSELLLTTWVREIERHFNPGSIRYIKYHGPDRYHLNTQVSQQDVILTTYGTVMADRRRGSGILHQVDWYRLVLDEAHTIRNCSTKQFNAVNSISSQIRWCLTGTPIQNSLEDLAALVRFLRMPIFEEPAIFRKHVTKVRQLSAPSRMASSSHEEFANLRLILSAICLRRNKSILPMHKYNVEDRRPCFQPHEREQYHQLELTFKRAISISSKGRLGGKSYPRVMEALLRLRMFCNNGAAAGLGFRTRPDEILSFLQQSGEAICADCAIDVLSIGSASDMNSGHITPCWRVLCGECSQRHIQERAESSNAEYSCGFCSSMHRTPSGDEEESQITPSPSREKHSSKIQCLVEDVRAHYQGHKCVIFSFWKTTLDLVSSALQAHSISHLRVDGDVTPKKRNSILLDFKNNNAWRVLVMTFSTGSIGLNGLTVANRVHIIEPQWNPAVESQAIGRVLRLDQQREVTVVRYAMQRSIEELVQSKQLRKLQLAGGGFSNAGRQDQKAGQLRQLQEYFDSAGPGSSASRPQQSSPEASSEDESDS